MIFRREGRSRKWKKLNKLCNTLIKSRREKYFERHKILITCPGAAARFFQNVWSYKDVEKPQIWNLNEIRPKLNDCDRAAELSQYFNKISLEFTPLRDSEIPKTFNCSIPEILPYHVTGWLWAFRKPKSHVKGVIFPSLVNALCDILALPLTDIYNCISMTFVWSRVCKMEMVTVIPKCHSPTTFEELRNISCTLLVSKVFECYLPCWAQDEVKTRVNPYGA